MKLPFQAALPSLLVLSQIVVDTAAFTATPLARSATTVVRSQTLLFAEKVKEATEAKAEVTEATTTVEEKEEEEEQSEVDKLFQQIKESGTAGAISLGLWEGAFWLVSIPVAVFGFQSVTGHWPDFSNQEDMGKLGAEAFAFVNFARFAVPLRVGLALGSTPWVQENIVDVFLKDKEEELEVVMDMSAEEEPVVEEPIVEEEPKKRGLGRLVPGFLRKKED